jgi:meso-butanediol dehydrogenase/(S,S)-butanediol dehydrogenase/diacetyl reductase
MHTDQVVVITGASSGIGRTTAEHYARNGAAVVNADVRDEPRAADTPTHEHIQEQGGDARFIETDVRDWDSVTRMIDRVVEEYGRIDLLVNNAGVAENGSIDELPVADAQRIFRVNVDGVYHGMRAAIPSMKEQGEGVIVNIASGAGKTGIPDLAAYCGSKFAVIGMTEAVAREVSDHGITVNAVCPGRTKTAMTDFEGVPPQQVAETIMEVAAADFSGRAVDV